MLKKLRMVIMYLAFVSFLCVNLMKHMAFTVPSGVYSNSEFYQSVILFYRGQASRSNVCQRCLQNVDLRCLNINLKQN